MTKISTIPNTSLFLTGSKDGDVKLWDAKNAKLVHQWSKLHERHTFLQPSTRGYGGVIRVMFFTLFLVWDLEFQIFKVHLIEKVFPFKRAYTKKCTGWRYRYTSCFTWFSYLWRRRHSQAASAERL